MSDDETNRREAERVPLVDSAQVRCRTCEVDVGPPAPLKLEEPGR